uniref:Oligosaccharyltransferase complex subunit n=1 Tax=Aquila chrysaetos chrysaetos TaxID=223781 RepID=A0A663EAH6_AQUCH
MVFAQKKGLSLRPSFSPGRNFWSLLYIAFFSFFFFFLLFVNLPLSGRSSQFPFPPSCPVAEGGRGGASRAGSRGAAAAAMETLYRLPFAVLECPNIKLKRPSWVHMPSAMTVYALVVVSYFLITGGIIYDVIVEPPSVGSMTDEHGHQRPVAFLAYRVNGQYIMEGLASSFLFTMGGLGFIILDRSNAPNIPKLNRFLLLFIGFVSVLLSFFMARVFMRMKLPGYLMG